MSDFKKFEKISEEKLERIVGGFNDKDIYEVSSSDRYPENDYYGLEESVGNPV